MVRRAVEHFYHWLTDWPEDGEIPAGVYVALFAVVVVMCLMWR